MTINLIPQLVRIELDKHNLKDWSFAWQRSIRILGTCNHNEKLILLSKCYVELNTFNLVYDTILHEIAHALVGSGQGHNDIWKRKAVELGAIPKTRSKSINSPDYKHLYQCLNCKFEFGVYRKLKNYKNRYHQPCGIPKGKLIKIK